MSEELYAVRGSPCRKSLTLSATGCDLKVRLGLVRLR